MRVPFTPLHRSFPEFESLTREECGRYVAYVRTIHPWTVGVAPAVLGVMAGVAAVAGPGAAGQLRDDVNVLIACVGAVAAFFFVWLWARDLLLWWFVRGEVLRARCPRCKHSLHGLPIVEIGDGLDPTMRLVRCVECGRQHRLFDLGITARDLVPFEQRGVPSDFAAVRTRRVDNLTPS